MQASKLLPVFLAFLLFSGSSYSSERLLVFAAASMTDVLTEVGKAFEEEAGGSVVFSFAATGTLARQIEAGAPADIFVSADNDWMVYAVEQEAVQPDTIVEIAANTLVVAGSPEMPSFELSGQEILRHLANGRLAIADPETVPAGRYARIALETMQIWPSVSQRLAPMENVRVALLAIARGDTPLGIVYGSDAGAEPRISVLATFPEHTHPGIRYLAALTQGAGRRAEAFLAYLSGNRAKAIFAEHGFLPVPKHAKPHE